MRKMELFKKVVVVALSVALVADLSLSGGGMTALADDEVVEEEVVVEDLGDEYEEEYDEGYEEEELELSKEKLNLSVGSSATLEVDGDYDEITWSSSKTKIASVNANGKVIMYADKITRSMKTMQKVQMNSHILKNL